MPNWCYTDIVFYSPCKSEIENFKTNIENALANPVCKDGEAKNWQGHIPRAFNLNIEGERGFVEYVGDIEETSYLGSNLYNFTIRQEDAWAPHTDMYDTYIQALGLDIDCVYLAEEPGCEVYVNTDEAGIFFPYRYIVDNSYETEYFETIHDALDYICRQDEAFADCTTISEAQNIAADLVQQGEFDWFVISEFTLS